MTYLHPVAAVPNNLIADAMPAYYLTNFVFSRHQLPSMGGPKTDNMESSLPLLL